MAPLIAMLAKAGLPLLANLVMEKGQEFAEKKLGVDLPSLLATDEGKIKLKQLEYENEADIRDFLMKSAELELSGFKEEVKDKDSARDRDKAFIAAGTRNYRADLMFVLAAGAILFMVYAVWETQGLDEYAKGIITLVLGRFLGYLDNIYNFEFGTTRGSRTKDATIDQLSRGPK